MANKVIGEVPFKVDGKDYILCFDNDALIEMEDKLDAGIVAITQEMQRWTKEPERLRLKWIRILLWAGLKKHQPNMTVKDAGEMIDLTSGGEMMSVIGDAISKSFGESETKGANPTNGANLTGTGEGSSPITSASDTTSKPSGDSLRVN